nr:phosphoethanolamine transferase CptA [Pantoea sp. 201603H]
MTINLHSAKQGKFANLLWLVLFFQFFSTSFQLYLLIKGRPDMSGLRDSILYSFLWLIPVFLLPRYSRVIAAVTGLILWAGSLGALGYYLIYNQQFSESVLFILFESNSNEAREFFTEYFSATMAAVLLIYTLIALFLWTRIKPLSFSPLNQLTGSVIVLIVLLFPVGQSVLRGSGWANAGNHLISRMVPAAPWQLIFSYVLYQQQLTEMDALLMKNNRLPPLSNLTDDSGNAPRTLVLVIGESTTRSRMSLYGYGRETNPNLMALKKSDANLSVFQHVVTSRPYTIEILQQALTFGDEHDPDRYLTAPSMLNLMKQAGYKTFWITNQQTITERNTMLTVFSRQTDQQFYLNQERSQDSPSYDSHVLSPFQKVLADPATRKFIVVHLLGTHIKYRYRYPNSDKYFTNAQGLPAGLTAKQIAESNDYDNAVRFNDYVLSRLIKTFSATDPNGFLLYLSDHGEEVFQTPPHDRQGRNENSPTRAMYTIPFILWTSPRWAADHPRDYSTMLDRKYSSAHLIQTWSDLAGLRYDLYKPQQSLVNAQFMPETRWIGDPHKRGGLHSFDELPYPQVGN